MAALCFKVLDEAVIVINVIQVLLAVNPCSFIHKTDFYLVSFM